MAVQIVMDHNGDTRHVFDARNSKDLAKAEQRFRELTGAGFTAAQPQALFTPEIVTTALYGSPATTGARQRCATR